MIPVPLEGKNTGSMLDTIILIKESFAVESSAALNIFATGLGLSPLVIAGNATQRAKLLTPFLDGAGDPVAACRFMSWKSGSCPETRTWP